MCKQFLFAILVFIIPPAVVRVQEEMALDYFPLEVGNVWTYFTSVDPPPAERDTVWDRTTIVSNTITINDTLYYLARYPFAPADTVRNDGEGRVWARVRGWDELLFDFTRNHGDVYPFPGPGESPWTYEVTVRRNEVVEGHLGHFEGCILLSFDDPASLDEQYSYAFAPGIGILYAYGNGGWYEELFAAQINGRSITATENTIPVKRARMAYAYPNPFRTATTIVVPLESPEVIQAGVYDVVGHRVNMPYFMACTTGECRLEINSAGNSSGVYYVVVTQGGNQQKLAVILVR